MNKNIFFLAGGILLLALVAVVALMFWPVPEGPVRESVVPESTPAPQRETVLRDSPTPVSTPTAAPDAPPAVVPLAAWEERLGDILTAPGDTATAARALLAAMSGLPEEAQEQYIAHALNLCEDSDFPRVEEIYLRQGTPPSVVEAIFNESLNRPDELKLPLMAKTMGIPNHPMADEARGILELYLELEPDAPPPGSWDIAVRDYLKKQQEP
jgi:hypothetical protein